MGLGKKKKNPKYQKGYYNQDLKQQWTEIIKDLKMPINTLFICVDQFL